MTTSQHRTSGVLSTSAIHPVLQTALTSLDVSLDAELARYRRQKAGFTAPPPRGFHAPKSPGVMPSPVSAVPSNPATPVGNPATPVAPSARTAIPTPQLGQNGVRTPASKVPKPEVGTTSTASTVAASTVAASTAALVESSVKPAQAAPTQGMPAQSVPDRDPLTTSESSATPVSTSPVDPSLVTTDFDPSTIPSGAIQLVKPMASASDSTDSATATLVHPGSSDPFDYLESSEELLKSLSEDEPDFTTIGEQPSFFRSLLTPVGIGSSLILLLSTATLGYVFLMNASGQIGLKQSDSPQTSVPGSGAESSSVISNRARAGLPNSPDLSSREFVDLNLNTLSTLKTNQSGASPLATQGAKPTGSQPNRLSVLPSPVQLGSGTTTAIAPLPIVPAPFISNDGRTIITQPGTVATTSAPASSQSVYAPDTTPVPSQAAATAPRPVTTAPRATAPREVAPAASQFPTPTQRALPPAAAGRSLPPAITTSPPAQSPSRATTPTSSPTAATSPSSAPARNAAQSPGYVVVSPYTGDRNLENAQRVVPDAYVRNYPDGARVQLGSYNDPEKARSVVEQLQRQGIDAQIQQP